MRAEDHAGDGSIKKNHHYEQGCPLPSPRDVNIQMCTHCKSGLIKKVAEAHCTLELHWCNISRFFVKIAYMRCIKFIKVVVCTFGPVEKFVF
jgi:hypothetical protein